MAFSNPRKMAMIKNIVVLIAIIISEVVNPNLLLVNSAMISRPSMTPPPLITKPIPKPTNTPPKAATRKWSFVISGTGSTIKAIPKRTKDNKEFMAKFLPIFLNPAITKGIFNNNNGIHTSM